MKKLLLWMLLPAIAFSFAACSTSQLSSSWTAKNASQAKFNKILVLGLLSKKNFIVKTKMEEELVKDLGKYGVNAVAASSAYDPNSFGKLNETEAMDKLHNDGYDGVITVALVDKDKSQRFVPGGWGPGFYPYYGSFWGYYSFYSPWAGPGWGYGGGYYMSTNYVFETNLYDVTSNNTLLYSAQSTSFDPSSAQNLSTDYARTIVKDLIKNGIVKQ
ncbi:MULTISPECIES: hypothetical protein [Chitinophagaceae]